MATHSSVQIYLDSLEPSILTYVNEVRDIILSLDSRIVEYSAYGIIGYRLNKALFYIGGFKNHIGLYGAIALVIEKFKAELKPYKTSKGTIQIPLNKALPLDLIKKIAISALCI